jgi:hypothetical protein
MTVRLTPIESDSTPPQQIPAPPNPSGIRVTTSAAPTLPEPVAAPSTAPSASSGSASESPGGGPSEPVSPTSADSRRALREAREHRRRVAWACAAVLALCLALTIVMVTLARYRSVPPSGSAAVTSPLPPSSSLSATADVSTFHQAAATPVDRTVRSPVPSRGAPVPEGGNP